MLITLQRGCYEQMLEHCIEIFPEEACGVLMAKRKDSSQNVNRYNNNGDSAYKDGDHNDNKSSADNIIAALPIDNAHPQKTNAFSFDPAQWVHAYYVSQQQGMRIVGIYHSHPTEKAVPSSSDMNGWLDEQLLYAIISLKQKDSPQLQFYRRTAQNQLISYPLVLT